MMSATLLMLRCRVVDRKQCVNMFAYCLHIECRHFCRYFRLDDIEGTYFSLQFNSFKFSATNYNYKIEIEMLYEYTKIIKLDKVKTSVHKIIITI